MDKNNIFFGQNKKDFLSYNGPKGSEDLEPLVVFKQELNQEKKDLVWFNSNEPIAEVILGDIRGVVSVDDLYIKHKYSSEIIDTDTFRAGQLEIDGVQIKDDNTFYTALCLDKIDFAQSNSAYINFFHEGKELELETHYFESGNIDEIIRESKAYINDNKEIIEKAIEKKTESEIMEFLTIYKNDPEKAKIFLMEKKSEYEEEKFQDLINFNDHGSNPLINSIKEDNLAVAQLLIEFGANMYTSDYNENLEAIGPIIESYQGKNKEQVFELFTKNNFDFSEIKTYKILPPQILFNRLRGVEENIKKYEAIFFNSTKQETKEKIENFAKEEKIDNISLEEFYDNYLQKNWNEREKIDDSILDKFKELAAENRLEEFLEMKDLFSEDIDEIYIGDVAYSLNEYFVKESPDYKEKIGAIKTEIENENPKVAAKIESIVTPIDYLEIITEDKTMQVEKIINSYLEKIDEIYEVVHEVKVEEAVNQMSEFIETSPDIVSKVLEQYRGVLKEYAADSINNGYDSILKNEDDTINYEAFEDIILLCDTDESKNFLNEFSLNNPEIIEEICEEVKKEINTENKIVKEEKNEL